MHTGDAETAALWNMRMSSSPTLATSFLEMAAMEEDHLPMGTAVAWTLGGAATAGALLAVLAVPTMYSKSKGEATETDALLAEEKGATAGSGSDADTASTTDCDS